MSQVLRGWSFVSHPRHMRCARREMSFLITSSEPISFRIVRRKEMRTRALHGGSWLDVADYCKSADRNANGPGNCHFHVGFRLGKRKR